MKSRLWLYVSVLVFCVLLGGVGIATAQDAAPGAGGFSNASIQGSYAVTSVDGNVGSLGICDMDGAGSFKCASVLNTPAAGGNRAVTPVTSTGAYTMTASGIGTVREVESYADGSGDVLNHLFMVTDAQAIGADLLATELSDSAPISADMTIHPVLRRLPDVSSAGGFSNASLEGVYAIAAQTGSGFVGMCIMDGQGGFTCSSMASAPGPNGENATVPISISGTYTLTASGIGTVHHINTLPDGSKGQGDEDILVTAAQAAGPYVIATELADLGRDAVDAAGGLSVVTLKRLPDLAGAAIMTGTMKTGGQ